MECVDNIQPAKAKRKVFDWISNPDLDTITPFQRFILDIDWEKSPLGPILQWPAQLRQMVMFIVQDTVPSVMYWGEEATVLYNEAYIQIIGNKHPALQGQDPRFECPDLWQNIDPMLRKQRDDFQTIVEADTMLMLNRWNYVEETYHSWKLMPMIGEGGYVAGHYATVVEITREVISDRRVVVVQNLARVLTQASSIKELWKRILEGLSVEAADKDLPLVLLYSTQIAKGDARRPSIPTSSLASEPLSCTLEGSIGAKAGHPLAPDVLDLYDTNPRNLGYHLRMAMDAMAPVVVEIAEVDEPLEWRGYGRATHSVICPIIPKGSRTVLAFLALALNPRRPYDEGYKKFIHLLTHQVTQPQLSAIILKEEVENRQHQARQEAIDRDKLSRELSASETRFARFASRAPIGLGILSPDGMALTVNELWKDLTKLEQGEGKATWADVLMPGSVQPVMEGWDRMIREKRSVTMQAQMNTRWLAPDLDTDGNEQFDVVHILLSMYPDLDENDEVDTVMSCITDISGMKWSEKQLTKKMDQAIEMKKQQERFIDMTSHEMRNPLSALIGCADEIIFALRECCRIAQDSNKYATNGALKDLQQEVNLLTESLENADTIIYCALHQKRIIDDILTLSRLDSNLLLVSPEPSKPIELIKSALKMFDAEVKRAETKLEFIEHKSLFDVKVEWVLLDCSRVLQVLINLVTNAIKFTKTEKRRHIKITMLASLTKPSEDNTSGIEYVRKIASSQDQTSKSEWGDGEVIYLTISVTDTGRGLTNSEKSNLFTLFQQASPKTHVQYGGSGLGLFISRQLTEMQGGEIGVASEPEKGSTFEFYVKGRRVQPPENEDAIPARNDLQLLVREDVLREACGGVEISELNKSDQSPIVSPAVESPASPLPIRSRTKKGFHILVVEDNLVNQKVVTKQLRKAGHVVSVANHGGEAIEFIQTTNYWIGELVIEAGNAASSAESLVNGQSDGNRSLSSAQQLDVVLMDLEMPIMDGLSCVKWVRDSQRKGRISGHIPVIAVTANARKDQILTYLDAGMDDVTTKPYRMQDMLKQIEKLMARQLENGTTSTVVGETDPA